jgi:cellulose synthase/poly-beta-1,6-N-acetylglucosamine synthase-like glycosyltransferase
MGDSICIRTGILRKLGWGSGLAEDYDFRQRLLLEGIRIAYEPTALGFGEAPRTWSQAQAQRARWLRGVYDVSHERGYELLLAGIRARNPALLDCAIQMYMPSYSTLTLLAMLGLVGHLSIQFMIASIFPRYLLSGWVAVSVVLFLYPLWGLALEQAPFKAFLVILSGPFYVAWRTWLAIYIRYTDKPIIWRRTSHEGQDSSK